MAISISPDVKECFHLQKGVETFREYGMEGREQFPGLGELICIEWGKKHKRFK